MSKILFPAAIQWGMHCRSQKLNNLPLYILNLHVDVL